MHSPLPHLSNTDRKKGNYVKETLEHSLSSFAKLHNYKYECSQKNFPVSCFRSFLIDWVPSVKVNRRIVATEAQEVLLPVTRLKRLRFKSHPWVGASLGKTPNMRLIPKEFLMAAVIQWCVTVCLSRWVKALCTGKGEENCQCHCGLFIFVHWSVKLPHCHYR